MKDTAIYKCELFYADQTGSNKNNVTSTTKLIVQGKGNIFYIVKA